MDHKMTDNPNREAVALEALRFIASLPDRSREDALDNMCTMQDRARKALALLSSQTPADTKGEG